VYRATLYRHKSAAFKRRCFRLLVYRKMCIYIYKGTRHIVTYYVSCRLLLYWRAVELLTFVYCIYHHRRFRYWAVFLSPDGLTLDGMPHRRNYTIIFVHIITGSMLPTLRSDVVQHKYLWWLCQSDVQHRILHFGTDCLQLYVQRECTFSIFRFPKEWNKTLNKREAIFVRK